MIIGSGGGGGQFGGPGQLLPLRAKPQQPAASPPADARPRDRPEPLPGPTPPSWEGTGKEPDLPRWDKPGTPPNSALPPPGEEDRSPAGGSLVLDLDPEQAREEALASQSRLLKAQLVESLAAPIRPDGSLRADAPADARAGQAATTGQSVDRARPDGDPKGLDVRY